jgi:hypothetical protein
MNFITPDNIILPNLDSKETVLLTAEKDTYIESILVCNKDDKSNFIRVSLKIIKALNVLSPVTAFKIRNLTIDRNMSKDLVLYLGNSKLLKNGDSLIISSAGYTEIFDCVVDFYELNEIVNV